MASGMEMLLKSFGLDPQKLVADFGGQLKLLNDTVKDVQARLERIEKKLDSISVEVSNDELSESITPVA